MELQSDLNDERLTETIRCLMEENYDLGKLTRVKEVLGGYCHKSYAAMDVDERSRISVFFAVV